MWLIGVEVEQDTSAPPPKKNPGSAPELFSLFVFENGSNRNWPVYIIFLGFQPEFSWSLFSVSRDAFCIMHGV